MGRKRTNKSKYQSKYGGGYITAAQRITEILCEIIAHQDKISLPDKFWNLPQWKKLYQQQIPSANSLLSKYPFDVIKDALYDNDIVGKIRSLRANWLLKPVLDKYMMKYNKKPTTHTEKSPVYDKPRKPMGGLNSKSIVEQLQDLE